MPTLSTIRDAGETDIEALLKQLDERHKEILRSAVRKYGVQNIPDSIWTEIQNNIEEETAAAILLLLIAADDLTTGQIAAGGIPRRNISQQQVAMYSILSAQQASAMAAGTTDTLRNRLTRKVQDQALTGRGALGNVTPTGIEDALDEVFTDSRRETMAIDTTTQAVSAGTRGAAERAGGDGGNAGIAPGMSPTIQLIWRTERDNLVCPRCSPLEGTTEDVWGLVFPEGPGPDCHPNCRCELEVRVVPLTISER